MQESHTYNNKSSRSIIATLTIAFVVMSVAVLVFAGGFGIYFLFQIQQEAIASSQQLIAHEAGSKVSSFIQEKFSVLETTAKVSDLINYFGNERRKILQILLGRQPAFRQIILLNDQENLLSRVSRLSSPVSMKFLHRVINTSFWMVRDGNRFIGSVYVDEATSEPLLIIAVPTKSSFGDFTGILVAEVNLKFMWDMVDHLKVGETGHVFVVDKHGNLIAFGDTGRVLKGENLIHLKEVAEFVSSTAPVDTTGATISIGINGNKVVGTYVPLVTPDWAVMTELPIKEAYQCVVQNVLISVGILFILALLAGTIGVFVARRLAHPLLKLTETANRITDGEMSLKADLKGPTEIASLSRAFNLMTNRLSHLLGKEEERTRKLEYEFEQRCVAEEALLENESILRATLESIQEGILVVTGIGNISHHNSRFCEIWSIPEGLIAKANDKILIDHVLPQLIEPNLFTAKVEELYQSSEPSEDLLHFKDGRILERFSYPLIRDGKVEGRVWFFRDITERRRVEQTLYLTQFAIDHASIGCFWIDSNGRNSYVNEQACRSLGYTREELLNLHVADIDPNYPVDAWTNTWQRLLWARVLTFETFHRRKDGSTFPVAVTGNYVQFGQNEYCCSYVLDMSEREKGKAEKEKLQAQLIQSQKMEAIGTLAGGIAHDFNNLLQAIHGYAELLLLRKKSTDEDYDELKEIRGAAKSGGELTQQLLTFGRKVDSHKQPFDLNRHINQTQKLLARTIPKMIDIELRLSPRLKTVNVDPVQMEQVIMNLALNAKDAMPEGGKLVIETENIALDEPYCRLHLGAEPGEYVLLTITDTGHGMDQETVKRIYEPFYSSKAVGEGTGLGLAMVYGIIKSHNGYIMCYSEPGEGTSFKVYLPAIESFKASVWEEPDTLPVGGTESILLVDDEDTVLKLGRQILVRFGYTVFTTHDGESAMDLFNQEKANIDLVILDLIMPGMGGMKCLAELIKRDPEVKVLVASGFTADTRTQEIINAGAKGFVSKPYEVKLLLNEVRDILDNR